MTKWYIKARSNNTLALVDAAIEHDYEGLTLIKRWNDVGSWVLGLRYESPHAATFLPDASGNLHNGIIVQVDNEDGNGLQTVMTGPQLMVDVSLTEQMEHKVVVTGACDNYWLNKRISLPFAGWPYPSNVMAGLYAPYRYYQLAESSGTVATDSSASLTNGTYNGTVGYSQPGLIADPSTCITFDGSTTFVSVPTTGFLTGNFTFSVVGWGKFSANPAGNAMIWSHGSNVANENFWMGINSSGQPAAAFGSNTFTGATALALNIPHCFEASWDHTTNTATFIVDGQQIGQQVFSAINIVYGVARIGSFVDNSSKWAGQIGHVAFFNNINIVTQYLDPRSLYPYTTWVYRVGQSELAYVDYAYGFSQGAQADKDLWNFIQPNLMFPPARMPFGFNAGSSPSLGVTSGPTYSRFDNLLTLCQNLALRSTPNTSFRLEQSGANINLTIALARNQSATAVFSLNRNNVRSYSWHYEAAKVNYVYAGGKQTISGVPESRVFAENSSATSISQFGRLEEFLDARQAPDQITLQSLISAELAKNSSIRSFAVTTQETPALYFKGPGANGYDVGDLVTTVLEGQTFQDQIREIQIDLQPNQPAMITPAIGTPNAAQVPNANNTAYNEIQNNGQATNSIAINY